VCVSCLLATTLGACASFAGRAAAPDQAGGRADLGADVASPARGPGVLVHVESVEDATLARLGENNDVVERCSAPCDRSLPIEGTYRIDGPDIRSSWPFHLDGAPGERVVLSVSPRLRSAYSRGNSLSGAGLVAAGVGFGAALIGGLVGTSAGDANGGAPAPCAACTVSVVGGGVLMIVGIGVATAGLVMTLSNLSSDTTEHREVPLLMPTESPRREGMWRLPDATETAWPRSTQAQLLELHF
jgi:hypothetical protein